MQRAFSRGDEEQAGGRFEDIGINAGADWKRLDHLARVDVHYGEHFVASADEQPAMLHVEINGRGFCGGGNRPAGLYRVGYRIDYNDFVLVLDIVVDHAVAIRNGVFGASTDWDGSDNR